MAYDFICKSAQVELERRIMDAGCRTMDAARWTIGEEGANSTFDGHCGGHLCCGLGSQ